MTRPHFIAKLDERDILQINATLIAGLLILLSIGGSILPGPSLELLTADNPFRESAYATNNFARVGSAFALLLPFVVSSILVLFENGKSFALSFMIAGFLSILIIFVFLIYLHENYVFEQFKRDFENAQKVEQNLQSSHVISNSSNADTNSTLQDNSLRQ